MKKTKYLPSNRQLAKKVGFRNYKPIRHFETKSGAESLKTDLSKSFKSLPKKDLKVCYEGRVGKTTVYSLLARTKRQQKMAKKTIRHTMVASRWKNLRRRK